MQRETHHFNPDFRWTDPAVAALKDHWADGLSASACAEKLGDEFGIRVSRSAVLGKINRLGLSKPHEMRQHAFAPLPRVPKTPKQPRKTVDRIIRGGQGSAMRIVSTPDFSEDVARRELSPDQIPLAQRKQLLDLGPDDCRWPYGDPGESNFFFCGAVTETGCSYCRMHRIVSTWGACLVVADAEHNRRMVLKRRLNGRGYRLPERGDASP